MFERFFGVNRKTDFHTSPGFETNIKFRPPSVENEIKIKKYNIIEDVDEIINDIFGEIIFKDDNSKTKSISPLIISPSETGETELETLEKKVKQLELELKNVEDNNNKELNIKYQEVQIEVEIPRYIIKAKESLDFNENAFNGRPMAISNSNYLHVENLNKIDNFLNINLRGHEELKSKRRFSMERNVCIMTFVKNDDEEISYYADNEKFKSHYRGCNL